MKELISKELLSEVLGMAIIQVDHYDNDENELPYWYDSGSSDCFGKVNIYELAHKCKEWAKKQGFTYATMRWDDFSGGKWIAWQPKVYEDIDGVRAIGFEADTEPGAIFKACQWILDNKDAK